LQVAAYVIDNRVQSHVEDRLVGVCPEKILCPVNQAINVLLFIATGGSVGGHTGEDLINVEGVAVAAMLPFQSPGVRDSEFYAEPAP